MNAVADYYSLHRSLKLYFINRKQKKTVEHLVSIIKPATLNSLIESKLEMDNSDLKEDFLEFDAYLKKVDIIHHEHCHVVNQKKTGDSGSKNMGKTATMAVMILDTTLEEAPLEVESSRCMTLITRSLVTKGRRTRVAQKFIRLEILRLEIAQKVCG
jgi:hypothetical protein